MKVKKSSSFDLEMKSDLDILNYGGHDYLLSASALPIDEQLFQPQLGILGEGKTTTMSCVVLLLRDDIVASATAVHSKEKKNTKLLLHIICIAALPLLCREMDCELQFCCDYFKCGERKK